MNRAIPPRMLCAVVALALSAAACSGGDGKASDTATTTGGAVASESTAAAPAVTEPEPELTFVTPGPSATASTSASASGTATATPAVAAGRVFAFIKDVLPGGANTGRYAGEATYDEAQFLTGAAAKKAAAADKKELDSDFYIRNQNTRLRTVEFSTEGVQFRGSVGLTGHVELSPVSLDQLRTFVETEQGQNTGFWLTIANVKKRLMITKIEEQYVP